MRLTRGRQEASRRASGSVEMIWNGVRREASR